MKNGDSMSYITKLVKKQVWNVFEHIFEICVRLAISITSDGENKIKDKTHADLHKFVFPLSFPLFPSFPPPFLFPPIFLPFSFTLLFPLGTVISTNMFEALL